MNGGQLSEIPNLRRRSALLGIGLPLAVLVAAVFSAVFSRYGNPESDAPNPLEIDCHSEELNSLEVAGIEYRFASAQDCEEFGISNTASEIVMVVAVRAGSPGETAGLQVGDALVLLDSRGVLTVDDLNELYVLGRRTALLYERKGTTHIGHFPAFNCRASTGPVRATCEPQGTEMFGPKPRPSVLALEEN